MLPQADVYPTAMRPTRDRLRRRMSRPRQRAERLGHVQQTHRQDTRSEIGTQLADNAHRTGVAERFPDPAVQKSMAVDLALIGYDDHLLGDLEFHLVNAAQPHEAPTVYRLPTVPGIGTILRLVLWDERPDIARFPSVQDVVSSCRLCTCAKESACQRDGTAGTKLGHASLRGAFSEAAVLFLRDNPAGQNYLASLEKQHRQGQALTVLAHQLARAVYDLLKRGGVCALETCLQGGGSGVGEPTASRGHDGLRLATGLCNDVLMASTNAHAHLGAWP